MPMTDAPNSGTKFDRRKPCLRYIGPLLGTTCGASVGRGDYTPPSCSAPPVGGGLRPAPLGKASVLRQFPLVPEHLPISRRGGPMCPPGHAFLRDPPTGRHAGRPLQILLQSSSTPKNRAGTEPRPYSRRMPVRDLPGHPQPRLPQGEMPGMTTGTPLSSFVPCSNVLRNRNPRKLRDGFQRRAQPSLWS